VKEAALFEKSAQKLLPCYVVAAGPREAPATSQGLALGLAATT